MRDGPNDSVPLREHLRELMAEQNRRYDTEFRCSREAVTIAMQSAEKAVLKSEVANDKRFEAGNEIKAAMKDQLDTYARKAEVGGQFNAVNVRLDALNDKLDAAVKQLTLNSGRDKGLSLAWAVAGGLVLLASTAISIYAALRPVKP